MKKKALHSILVVAVLFLTASCGVNKYIAPSDKVLSRNDFQVQMADSSETPKEIQAIVENLDRYTLQQPNKRALGLMRLKMRMYCFSNPRNNNGFHRYLRRTGEAPVVYDNNSTLYTAQQLQGLLVSKGCFHSTVTFDTTHNGTYDLNVTYHLMPSTRFQIEDYTIHAESPEVQKLLLQHKDECLIQNGDYYDQDIIAQERDRVTDLLLNNGYYRASQDIIRFWVDTTYASSQLSIDMVVSNPTIQLADKTTQQVPLRRYSLDKIYIYPDNASENNSARLDTTLYVYTSSRGYSTNYYFVHSGEMPLKAKTIARNMFLFNHQTYRPQNLTRTYNSLLTLKNFKYINLDVVESPLSTDSLLLLDARVRLANNMKQKVSASLELTNSSSFGNLSEGNALTSGNFGLEGVLSYENKNLFGGAEILKTEGSLLVELPKLMIGNREASEFHDKLTAFEIGLDMSLDVPNFLLPVTKNISWQQTKPHTVFNLGANYQYRYYFERILANTSMGYSWQKNRQIQNQLLPLELTYVRFIHLDEDFLNRIAGTTDPRLKYQYSDHFIMDARYDFVYNSQQFNTRTNFSYFHLSVESAGNLLQGICLLTHQVPDDNGIQSVFGVPYSQYVRFNGEWKHYFYMGKKSSFVTRCMIGLGLPYTNSTAMPYEKSFFGGGPTTLRAWQLRHLGPGNFVNQTDQMFERIGDMSLVINLEERFPLFGIFEGAIFADLGNVWLYRPSEEWEGGAFSLKTLPQSIAVGAGFGLRLNISILTVRADFAIPLFDPGYAEEFRWRPPHWKFNQIVTNFGIDYPF